MSFENDILFMRTAIDGFFRLSVGATIAASTAAGYDIKQGRFRTLLPKAPYKMPVSVWLARYYSPVADAMFDGRSHDDCIAIWRVTKACDRGAIRMPSRAYDRATMQAGRMAREEYARGWRSKSDWKTVK